MVKPLQVGERVTWTTRDHGKDKKQKGLIHIIDPIKKTATVNLGDGEMVSVMLARLNRCRGPKPA